MLRTAWISPGGVDECSSRTSAIRVKEPLVKLAGVASRQSGIKPPIVTRFGVKKELGMLRMTAAGVTMPEYPCALVQSVPMLNPRRTATSPAASMPTSATRR